MWTRVFFSKAHKKQTTIRMGVDVVDSLKNMSEETGIPCQDLINLYLQGCVANKKRLTFR